MTNALTSLLQLLQQSARKALAEHIRAKANAIYIRERDKAGRGE